ncbi:MAG: Trm112 family protein [Promethearchaeati archaeon]
MRLWLFDILACPICKHYPLKLYIFSYQAEEDKFKKYLKDYNENTFNYENQDILKISQDSEEKILIKDEIVIEKKPIIKYLEDILTSVEELKNIEDLSSYEKSKKCLSIAREKIFEQLIEFSKKSDLDHIESIIPELIFLNKLKIDAEIESGILFCNECNRWFPIIDTIPRMLPDEYRDKAKELDFLKSKKDILNEEFFNLDLKPFNLQ